MAEELTPMLRQYRAMRQDLDGDALLLFRLGDFYELFMDDARRAAPLLGLALTHRAGQPMCGIPHHALDAYLAKIVRAGLKAAICDQMEDPKSVKGGRMVRREITRIVTPGTVTEETLLAEDADNYLVAVVPETGKGAEGFVVGVLELSTGELFCEAPAGRAELSAALARLSPGEAIVPDRAGAAPQPRDAEVLAALAEAGVSCVTPVDEWYFDPVSAHDELLRHFGVASLDGFGCEGRPALDAAAGALLRRVREDLHRDVAHIRRLSLRPSAGHMALDETTRAHLNLFPDGTGRNPGASLYEVLNATCTPMGARLLRAWLGRPLCDKAAIDARLDAVGALVAGRSALTPLRNALSAVRDLARAIARVSLGRGGARDVAAISAALRAVPALRERLAPATAASPLLAEVLGGLLPLPELADEIDRTLADELPATLAEGGVVRRGFSPELDALRDAQTDGRAWIAQYQASEAARTGIKNLKVRYNRVFGYFIEVTASQLKSVPEDYLRKQTIAGGERFTTPALKEREQLIAGAQEKALELEQRLFEELRAHVVARTGEIQGVADAVARLDVLCAFADRALALGYARPEIDEGDAIDIRGGRHPIVEQLPGSERFVPNDARLDRASRQILVITGPNMAGKSTYLRQVALIAVLAQAGSFVPADSARIGLVDRVFTRVGAADDLARGRSTFLVEMQETANILHNATPRSLIVLDEIGRGTSTFDGISIAWAVAEYLHDEPRVKARTLFATHYHELTDLALSKPGVANCSVLVRERGDGIVFLRRIVDGPADRSYGIAVAKLAGMPEPVLARARQILANLEANEISEATGQPAFAASTPRPRRAARPGDDRQMTLF
jgi:DNA mismatch repair protein MutS